MAQVNATIDFMAGFLAELVIDVRIKFAKGVTAQSIPRLVQLLVQMKNLKHLDLFSWDDADPDPGRSFLKIFTAFRKLETLILAIDFGAGQLPLDDAVESLVTQNTGLRVVLLCQGLMKDSSLRLFARLPRLQSLSLIGFASRFTTTGIVNLLTGAARDHLAVIRLTSISPLNTLWAEGILSICTQVDLMSRESGREIAYQNLETAEKVDT